MVLKHLLDPARGIKSLGAMQGHLLVRRQRLGNQQQAGVSHNQSTVGIAAGAPHHTSNLCELLLQP
jgi:hypothetical protein